jgi:hypothetical protein
VKKIAFNKVSLLNRLKKLVLMLRIFNIPKDILLHCFLDAIYIEIYKYLSNFFSHANSPRKKKKKQEKENNKID